MTATRTYRTAAVWLALTALSAGAATPVAQATGDTGPADAVTLRLGNHYPAGYVPAVDHFADAAGGLSDGSVTIEIVSDYGQFFPDDSPEVEQLVAQAVADGDLDLAWIGVRVLDTLGVTSFQALHAPFLVDSYELQAAVLESDIPERMLPGLEDIDVVGLTVLGGGLRKPFGAAGPFVGLGDYDGITLQTYRSGLQADTYSALGATPTDAVGGVLDGGLITGEIDGREHSLRTWVHNLRSRGGIYDIAPYSTANVNLWPEWKVLIANPDTLAGLDDAEVEWLDQAAADASAVSVGLYDIDDEMIAEACDGGARFAEAGDDDLAALRQAVQPVYDTLNDDADTAAFIAEIEALAESIEAQPLAIPEGCAAGAVEAPAAAGSLAGTYTIGPRPLEEYAETALAAGFDEELVAGFLAAADHATETWSIFIDDAGRFAFLWAADDEPLSEGVLGTYVADETTLVFTENPPYDCAFELGYELDGDTLQFTSLDGECPSEEDDFANMVFTMILTTAPFVRVDGTDTDTTDSVPAAEVDSPATGDTEPAVEPETLRMATPYCDGDLALGVGSRPHAGGVRVHGPCPSAFRREPRARLWGQPAGLRHAVLPGRRRRARGRAGRGRRRLRPRLGGNPGVRHRRCHHLPGAARPVADRQL